MLKQPPRDKRRKIGTPYFTAFPDFCGKKIPFKVSFSKTYNLFRSSANKKSV